MQSIPNSSPLMLMFAAPASADKAASPLTLDGEVTEFSSIFSGLVTAQQPSLEQVGRSPLMADYGKNLPLGELNNSGSETDISEVAPDELGLSEQETIEDMSLFLSQFGYVVSNEQANKAVTNTTTNVQAEEGSEELLNVESEESEINAQTTEQLALAQQQAQTTQMPPATEAQTLAQQTVVTPTTVAANQPSGLTAEQLKNASQAPAANLSAESEGDDFLNTGLADKPTPQNTTAANEPVLAVKTLDVSAKSLQPIQVNIASLQAGQTNQINTLTQATAVNTPEGFAGAALSQEVLDMDQDARQWGNSLSQRIVTMIGEDVQQARIQLDPPELGSLQVRLQIQNDQATVHVQVQHAHVREALESNAFRLRDALASQGVELDSFDVDSNDQQQGNLQQQAEGQTEGQSQGQASKQSDVAVAELQMDAETGEWLIMDESDGSPIRATSSVNLLDTFA